jgi:hypothetical protein
MMGRAVVDCGLPKAAAARQFNTTPKTVAKWLPRRGRGGFAGPFVKTPFIAKPSKVRRMRGDRGLASAAS